MTAPLRPRRATVTVELTEEELRHILKIMGDGAADCVPCVSLLEKLRRARVAKPRRKP